MKHFALVYRINAIQGQISTYNISLHLIIRQKVVVEKNEYAYFDVNNTLENPSGW